MTEKALEKLKDAGYKLTSQRASVIKVLVEM